MTGLLKQLISRWKIVALCVVAAASTSHIVSVNLVEPEYLAKAVVFMADRQGSVAAYNYHRMNNQLFKDYIAILLSEKHIHGIMKDLGGRVDPDRVKRSIHAEKLEDSRFFSISFADSDPALTAAVLNNLADSMAENVEAVLGDYEIRVIDRAVPPLRPEKPDIVFNMVLSASLGFFFGIFLIVAMHLDGTFQRDDCIRTYKKLARKVLHERSA